MWRSVEIILSLIGAGFVFFVGWERDVAMAHVARGDRA